MIKWTTQKRKIDDLIPYENNPRVLNDKQKKELKDSLEKFGLAEIPAINTDNKIIAGHQRLKILQLLGKGKEEIDVRVPERELTKEEFDEYLIRSNKNTGDWNYKMLDLFDRELLLQIGFGSNEIKKILGANSKKADARLKLQDRFIIPPFSLFDTRQGYWQDRKRAWLELTGDLSLTKENVLWKSASGGAGAYYQQKTQFENFLNRKITNEEFEEKYYNPNFINGGSSTFDPVLAEIIYTWFCPKNGSILDPFGGEQTKAVVAGELDMGYSGVEIRTDQVKINNEYCEKYKNIKFFVGDSNKISDIIEKNDFDLVFTSPPYYDLEIYSKKDMSALGTYEEFMAQYKNIFRQCVEKLKDDRFLVVKLGEIRNKKTGEYRNFIADSIKIFKELGLTYYNEIILINSTGTLPIRAPRSFNKNRKIGKCHQNILIFYKGESKKLFKETHAITATHQNILIFYKGDTEKIKKYFGDVSVATDVIASDI